MAATQTGPVGAPEGDEDQRPRDELAALVVPAIAGDRSAMRTLLAAVAPVVVRAVRRVLGRTHPDAEDVVQQALSGLVGRLAQFRGASSVAHFAERIAVYRALTARRDAGVRRRLVADVALESTDSDGGPSPFTGAAEQALRALLLAALDTLSGPQAEALTLHFLFDHTVTEIAGMVGAPEETVRSRLRLGKQALRERIDIEQAEAFNPTDPFRVDRLDARRMTAWVIVERAVAHVLAAGAGRERFVFRDVVVSHPLTELDRERVGQTLKIALLTIAEGGGSPPVIASRPVLRVAPGVPIAIPPATKTTSAIKVGLAGFYRLSNTDFGAAHASGITLNAAWTGLHPHPEAWLSVHYDFRRAFGGPGFRAGLGVAPTDWLHVEIGAGIDRLTAYYLSSPYPFFLNSPTTVLVARGATRLGPLPVMGLQLSATALLELARLSAPEDVLLGSVSSVSSVSSLSVSSSAFSTHAYDWRPGLAIEVWWL